MMTPLSLHRLGVRGVWAELPREGCGLGQNHLTGTQDRLGFLAASSAPPFRLQETKGSVAPKVGSGQRHKAQRSQEKTDFVKLHPNFFILSFPLSESKCPFWIEKPTYLTF
jgi:hypothetical protein